MALCPLAVASAGKQSDGSGDYYFTLAGGGGAGPTVESAFVAMGFPVAPGSAVRNNGFFSAVSEDTTGGGTGAFVMTDISGVNRWAIGTAGTEGGANSGDNFAIYSYADNGAFLAAPMTINRASGGVQIFNGLTVGNTLISTGPIVGPNGPVLAQQLDFLQFQSAVLPATPAAGQTIFPIGGTFTVPRTGMYILTGLMSYNGSGGTTFVAAPQDYFTVIVAASPPSPGSTQGGVTVSLTNAGPDDRTWEGVATVKLTGGIPYQANFFLENISGTVAATGGAALVGSFDLVALC